MELYHGTTVQNLGQITPHHDGHENTAYVFATPNFASALRYITPSKGNLYFGIEKNTAIIVEKFPNAFEKTYRNISGCVYALPPDKFKLTNLKNRIEYISNEPITPIRTISITNALEKLHTAESMGHIKIYRYPDTPQNYTIHNENIFQQIRRFIYKKMKGHKTCYLK